MSGPTGGADRRSQLLAWALLLALAWLIVYPLGLVLRDAVHSGGG